MYVTDKFKIDYNKNLWRLFLLSFVAFLFSDSCLFVGMALISFVLVQNRPRNSQV